MIIPWGTDADVRHRPIATALLMGLNLIVFLIMSMRGGWEGGTLLLGAGIHPPQWVTNLFLHADLIHLAGNLVILWRFGMMVEGKLGGWGLLSSDLGLGVLISAGLQWQASPEPPVRILGSSGVVCGLVAMSLVWVPASRVHSLRFWRMIPAEFDVPVFGFALGSLVWGGIEAFSSDTGV